MPDVSLEPRLAEAAFTDFGLRWVQRTLGQDLRAC